MSYYFSLAGATSLKKLVLKGELPERNLKFVGKDIDAGEVGARSSKRESALIRSRDALCATLSVEYARFAALQCEQLVGFATVV